MSTRTNRIITLLIVAFILATTAPAFAGQIIYVDDDGPADFNNIQAAIDAAVEGDTVIVAEGRYVENINFNGRNITLTSTDPGNPDVVAATIIDGNRNGSVITFNSGEDANCVLNGFKITNGNAERGGGIYCGWSPGTPPTPPPPPGTLNEQSSPEVLAGYGLPCPTINNCIITGNTASNDGGGIYCGLKPSPPSPPSPSSPGAVGAQSSPEVLPGYNFYGPVIKNCIISNNSAGNGGGMLNFESNPTLTNCTFSNNSANWGGGMLNLESNPILTKCLFSGNSASVGGGMLNLENSPTLTNCTFTDNSAEGGGIWGGGGGGMCNFEASPTLTNCTFTNNSSEFGGGISNMSHIHIIRESNPILTNCLFSGNSASVGGGMCNYESNPTLTNCTFTDNSAVGSEMLRGGGGMYNSQSSPTVTNCKFSGNSAGYGGGVMYNRDSSPTLTNCKFSGNSAGYGGGVMYNRDSSPTLTNCTFTGNSAVGTGWYYSYGYGGAMYNEYSSAGLVNCTFTGNWARAKGGAIMWIYTVPPPYPCQAGVIDDSALAENLPIGNFDYTDDSNTMITNCIFWENMDSGEMEESAQIYVDPDRTPIIINYNCIQGWTGTLGGTGNIDADPCFVAPGHFEPNCILGQDYHHCTYDWIDGDYHLLPDSPCINAGDPNYVAGANETDLDGKPRVIGCRIDMGVFEYWQLVPAEARIVPHTINMANQRKWITCYIYFPEAYNVADIDFCVLLLEYEIEPEKFWFNEKEQVVIAKFSHEQLQRILNVGEVELTISVQLTDGTVFEGTDVIRVIYEGGGKLAKYGKPSNPYPADGTTGVIISADLNWTTGYGATSHDMYFGTNSPPPFVCNQTSATFDPGTMVYSTTYFWRIDEINKWGKTTGDLWSFTTRPPPPPHPW